MYVRMYVCMYVCMYQLLVLLLLSSSQFHKCPSPTHRPPLAGGPGLFAHVVRPGGGAFTILSRLEGWAFAYPGEIPRHLTFEFNILSKWPRTEGGALKKPEFM